MPPPTGSDPLEPRPDETSPRSGPLFGPLFGAHKGSVSVAEGVDLTAPVLQDGVEADTPPMP